MTRKLSTETVQRVETATSSGWELRFETAIEMNVVKQVTVQGQNNDGYVYASSLDPSQGTQVNFSGGSWNGTLANAIIAEIETIFSANQPEDPEE